MQMSLRILNFIAMLLLLQSNQSMGQLSYRLGFNYDDAWVQNWRQEYRYIKSNGQRLLDEHSSYWIDDDLNKGLRERLTYTYDKADRLIREERNEIIGWDTVTYSRTYSYNALNQLELEIHKKKTQGENMDRWIYTYDHDSLLEKVERQYGNDISGWIPTHQQIYYYDSQENVTMKVYFQYQTSSGSWRQRERWLYTYHPPSMSDSVLTEYFIDSTQTWDPLRLDVYHKDDSSLVSMKETYYYTDSSAWTKHFQNDYTYNAKGEMTEEVWKYHTDGFAQGYRKFEYFYLVPLTVESPIQSDLILLFPNPSKDFISIIYPSNPPGSIYRIFDAKGANVLSVVSAGERDRINITTLDAGMYWIEHTATQERKAFIKQ